MLPYFLLLLLPATVGKFRLKFKKRVSNSNGSIVLFFCLFFILLSLRARECGADIVEYYRKFALDNAETELTIRSVFSHANPLYFLFERLVGLTGSFRLFMILSALLTILPLMLFYRKNAELPYLTILLFASIAPFGAFFSALRQGIAIGLSIPAWELAKRRKPLPFLLNVGIAALFHKSALVLLFLYPASVIRIEKKHLWLIVPLLAATYFFSAQLLGMILNTFAFAAKYARYFLLGEGDTSEMLILLLLFALFVYILPEEEKLDRDTITLRNLLILSLFIQSFAPIHPLIMRLNYYFLIFVPILIPRIINRSKASMQQVSQLAVYVLELFFLFWFFYHSYRSNDIMKIFPYIPFWEANPL